MFSPGEMSAPVGRNHPRKSPAVRVKVTTYNLRFKDIARDKVKKKIKLTSRGSSSCMNTSSSSTSRFSCATGEDADKPGNK